MDVPIAKLKILYMQYNLGNCFALGKNISFREIMQLYKSRDMTTNKTLLIHLHQDRTPGATTCIYSDDLLCLNYLGSNHNLKVSVSSGQAASNSVFDPL